MADSDYRCKRCGAMMAQMGQEGNKVRFHCKSCGYNDFVTMSSDDNSNYWHERSELLSRIRNGIFDWQTASWDYLRKDVIYFTGKYEAARSDIYFKIALVACVTEGFHSMDTERYRQCKIIFKATERIYKEYLKDPNPTAKFAKQTGNSDMTDYEEYRDLYKRCRNEYRNGKIWWKIIFFFAKKAFPMPKL